MNYNSLTIKLASMANMFFRTLILLILSNYFISIPKYSFAAFLEPIVNPCLGPQKSTKIQVYIHAMLSGPNQSLYEVARSSITASSPTQFGLLNVVDVKLTTGPDYDSPEVGRSQGLLASSDLSVVAYTEVGSTVYFTSGKFTGSTLTVLGRNPLFQQEFHELTVVGGTGMFRCARGYVLDRIYSTDNTTTNLVVQAIIYTTYVDQI